MQPYVQIVDGFFSDLAAARKELGKFKTADTVNPRDGKVYSNITVPKPSSPIVAAIGSRLSQIMHAEVRLKLVLSRLSLKGGYVPYHAHSDAFMGANWSVVIYLNQPEHCQGGTAFLRHADTGLEVWNKQTPKDVASKLDADVGQPEKWKTTFMAPMRANRAIIYPGELIHQSEPLDGFGTTAKDGRVVVVALFNIKRWAWHGKRWAEDYA